MVTMKRKLPIEFIVTLSIILCVIALNFYYSPSLTQSNYEFMQRDVGVAKRIIMNHSDHPYPFTASVIIITCLFGTILVIICLGGNL
jgi:hypothetical protein